MSDESVAKTLVEQVRAMLRERMAEEPRGGAEPRHHAIGALLELARQYDWSDDGVLAWLNGPTTYFDGKRPIDFLASDPDAVVRAARADWGIEW